MIGEITTAMAHNSANAAGEIALGDVLADAQLAATQAAQNGGALVAFMNPGGIRSPGFTFASSAANEGDGKVTYGEAFSVQPFGNTLVTLSVTGEQLRILLEQQFTGCNSATAPASFNYPPGIQASRLTGYYKSPQVLATAGTPPRRSAKGGCRLDEHQRPACTARELVSHYGE